MATAPPPSSSLTSQSLLLFTQHHPPNARRTVHDYLKDQQHRSYSPILLSPPSSRPLRPRSPSPPSFHSRDPEYQTDQQQQQHLRHFHSQRETALVLEPIGDSTNSFGWRNSGGLKRERIESEEREKKPKKPSLVSAMKPRQTSSSLAQIHTVAVVGSGSGKKKKTEVLVDNLEKGKEKERAESPVLLARVDRAKEKVVTEEDDSKQKKPEKNKEKDKKRKSSQEDHPVASTSKAKTSKSTPLPLPPSPSLPRSPPKAKSSDQKTDKAKEKALAKQREVAKAKRARGPDFDSEEEKEHMDRLEARRQRRLKKALVVKDKTMSARATGLAAATRVSKAQKGKKKKDDDDSSADEEEEEEEKRGKKKKRKSATENVRLAVQKTEKPSNVGKSRLTMRPHIDIGLFHKGKASARTATGKKQRQPIPDLAFSELTFLNSTKRPPLSPTATSSSSSIKTSSSSSLPSESVPSRKISNPRKIAITDSTKAPEKSKLKPSKIEPSKYFARSEEKEIGGGDEEVKKKDKEKRKKKFEVVIPPPSKRSLESDRSISVQVAKATPYHQQQPESPARRQRGSSLPTRSEGEVDAELSSGHSEFSRAKAEKGKAKLDAEEEDEVSLVDDSRQVLEGEDGKSEEQSEQVMDTTNVWKAFENGQEGDLESSRRRSLSSFQHPPRSDSQFHEMALPPARTHSRMLITNNPCSSYPLLSQPRHSSQQQEPSSIEAIDQLLQACRDERLPSNPNDICFESFEANDGTRSLEIDDGEYQEDEGVRGSTNYFGQDVFVDAQEGEDVYEEDMNYPSDHYGMNDVGFDPRVFGGGSRGDEWIDDAISDDPGMLAEGYEDAFESFGTGRADQTGLELFENEFGEDDDEGERFDGRVMEVGGMESEFARMREHWYRVQA